jgi:hypothetical protein
MDTEDRDHFKTIQNPLVSRPAGSVSKRNAASSHSGLDPAYCLSRARLMFSCYRKDETHDPETYSAAVASIFEGWSRAVVEYVTDPRTGIASELKWLPSVAEVRSACLAAETRLAALAKPDFKIQRHPYSPPLKLPAGTSYVEMVKKYGRPIGLFERPDDEWNRHRIPAMPSAHQ